MRSTLVLDQAYRPHRVVSWQRAICMLLDNVAEVVEEYDEEIKSMTLVLKMPAVVRLLRKLGGRKHKVKFSRINVATRDGFRCQYCNQKFTLSQLTYDHVLPRHRGGKTTWENIVCACRTCNGRKGSRTPEEAGMKLTKRPEKPHSLPFMTLHVDLSDIPSCWASYLYWYSGLEEG